MQHICPIDIVIFCLVKIPFTLIPHQRLCSPRWSLTCSLEIQTIKLLSTQSFLASCHCLYLTIQYPYHNFQNERFQALLMKCNVVMSIMKEHFCFFCAVFQNGISDSEVI